MSNEYKYILLVIHDIISNCRQKIFARQSVSKLGPSLVMPELGGSVQRGKCPLSEPYSNQSGQIMPTITTGPLKVFHLPASLAGHCMTLIEAKRQTLLEINIQGCLSLLLFEGIPRAYRGKKLRLKNILFFPSKYNGKLF